MENTKETTDELEVCPRCNRGRMYILEDSNKRTVLVCKNCMYIIKTLK